MNLVSILFALLAGICLFRLPKAWAPLPLLVGATYMTLGQELLVGPFHFTVIRILVAVGVARVVARGERIPNGLVPLDRMMMAWAVWAVCSSCFHQGFSSALVSRLGLVYDSLGLYFLLRVFIEDLEGILRIAKIIIILLTPVALEMVAEHFSGRNAFAVFGGILGESEVRGGRIRAQGPFGHSILAGTVGAVCWPMALMLWKGNRKLALVGLGVCLAVVVASSSSGPLMTTAFILLALAFWKVRAYMRLVRWGALAAIIGLDLVMKAPVYYLISRIDLTGSSTGGHRSALIAAAIDHFGEWWVGGTDYTRHWLPYGVPWSESHVDITNHYIKMGVVGGVPLMLLFIGILVSGFRSIGRALKLNGGARFDQQFRIWILGAILFGHAATFLSISYFDQSIIFLCLCLAAIGSLDTAAVSQASESVENAEGSPAGDEANLCHHC